MKTTDNIGSMIRGMRGLIAIELAALALILVTASGARAQTTYHVSLDGDGSDGLSWLTAFKTIQAGITATTAGDIVIVSNGTYIVSTTLTVNKHITLTSLAGAADTIIDGNQGSFTMMTISHADAVVEGFTLRNTYFWATTLAGVNVTAGTLRDCVLRNFTTALVTGDGNTSALILTGSNALGERLMITANGTHRNNRIVLVTAGARLRNSLVTDNYLGDHTAVSVDPGARPVYGAGPAVLLTNGGAIEHCTIAGNYARRGLVPAGLRVEGAASTVRNSIIYHNRDRYPPITDVGSDLNVVHRGGTIEYSIMAPLVAGTGNRADDPQFAQLARGFTNPGSPYYPNVPLGDYRLGPGSPAIGAGVDLGEATDADRDGNPRTVATPDIGAYEAAAADEGDLRISFSVINITAVGTNVTADFKAVVAGSNTTVAAADWSWDFGNGMTADAGAEHSDIAYENLGSFTVRVEVTNDDAETAAWSNIVYRAPEIVHVATSGSAAFPFDTEVKATACLQSAIAAAAVTASGTSSVVIAAGTYNPAGDGSGEYTAWQLHKPILIHGAGVGKTFLCKVYKVRTRAVDIYHAGAELADVTIRRTRNITANMNGGGVYMTAGMLRDSRIENCRIAGYGGGIYLSGGLVDRCVITDNYARLNHGGGVYVTGTGIVRNSLIVNNVAGRVANESNLAGGAYIASGGRIENCSIVDNAVSIASENTGGVGAPGMRGVQVAAGGVLVNSIVWYNRDNNNVHRNVAGTLAGVTHTAAPELTHDPAGTGNISDIDHPGFVVYVEGGSENDFRLTPVSPCVNAGTTNGLEWIALPGAIDLDGNSRLIGRNPDMGAYEFHPPMGTIFIMR